MRLFRFSCHMDRMWIFLHRANFILKTKNQICKLYYFHILHIFENCNTCNDTLFHDFQADQTQNIQWKSTNHMVKSINPTSFIYKNQAIPEIRNYRLMDRRYNQTMIAALLRCCRCVSLRWQIRGVTRFVRFKLN